MSGSQIDIKGMPELEAQLKELAGNGHKNAVVAGTRAGGAVVRKAARLNLAPHKKSGNLAKSIMIKVKAYDDHVIASIGPSTSGFYGYILEMGHSKAAPKPFLLPVLPEKQDEIKSAISEKIQSHINKIVAKSRT